MENIKMRVSGIDKSFPGVKALDNVNFTVRKGTVHALCGENGAGKSTLMKIINGLYKADSGQIFLDEKPVEIKSPIQARDHGIAMIAQELNYVPEMSIEENLFLGRLPVNQFGKIDWKKVRAETIKFLEQENPPYDPQQKLKTLTVSDIQMLEIIKAISNQADIVIMDEPTSAITNREVEVLFQKIDGLKKRGVSIIYISHKMEEVFRIADDITVLRDGKTVETHPAEEIDLDTVIALMVGRKMENVYPKEEVPIGEPILEVEGLGSKGVFKNISFYARQGEIVGFAGLMGAGRTEAMRAVFGLDPYDEGKLKVRGKEVTVRKVSDSIRNKVDFHSTERRNAWEKESFEKRTDVKIVAEDIANWNKDEAMALMEDWVQANGKIDAVISMNDNMAAGAIEVIKDNPDFKDMLAYGVDGTAEACLLIEEGKMTSTGLQSAIDLAKMNTEAVYAVLKGEKKVTDINDNVPAPLITKDNVAEYIEMYKKNGQIKE